MRSCLVLFGLFLILVSIEARHVRAKARQNHVRSHNKRAYDDFQLPSLFDLVPPDFDFGHDPTGGASPEHSSENTSHGSSESDSFASVGAPSAASSSSGSSDPSGSLNDGDLDDGSYSNGISGSNSDSSYGSSTSNAVSGTNGDYSSISDSNQHESVRKLNPKVRKQGHKSRQMKDAHHKRIAPKSRSAPEHKVRELVL